MLIKINLKKQIEGQKPVFDFQGPTEITLKTDQDFASFSTSLYLAGSRVYKDSSKILFFSNTYTINENKITFIIDTYTENYLKYISEYKTPFNLEFGSMTNEKTIFLLDKAFANPRVYIPGVPPSGNLDEYYTKLESNSIFSTINDFNNLSGIVSGDIFNLSNNYWTKYEVASAIANVQTMKIVVVQELPPIAQAEEYTVYLVPSSDSSVDSVYDEYLVINGAYEKIGTTAVDLTNYAVLSGGNTFTGNQKILGDIILGDPQTTSYCSILGENLYSNIERQPAYGSILIGRNCYWNAPIEHMISIGRGQNVNTNKNSVAIFGQWGTLSGNNIFVVGNGSTGNNSNALTLNSTGDLTVDGDITFTPSGALSGITLTDKFNQYIHKGINQLNVNQTFGISIKNDTIHNDYTTAFKVVRNAVGRPDIYLGGWYGNTPEYDENLLLTVSSIKLHKMTSIYIQTDIQTGTFHKLYNATNKLFNLPAELIVNGDITFTPSGALSGISLTDKFNQYMPLSGTQFNANDSFTITTSTGKQFVYFDDRNNGKSSIYFGNPNSTYDLQFLQVNAEQIRLDTEYIMHNNHPQNTAGGIVVQDGNGIIKGQKVSQNKITTIPPSSATYTLQIGEFNHVPENAVTYTLPSATTNYSNEIVLQVLFTNTTSISFSGTYEYDKAIIPSIDDDIIYLIRYSDIKQKWIIYPMI